MIGISNDKHKSKQRSSTEFHVIKLKVNGLTEPLGLDEQSLQFSWQLLSTVRGARPLASRVLIATSEARLNQDDADGLGQPHLFWICSQISIKNKD